MTVMSEGLLPNSKYVKIGHEEVGFQAHAATPCNCLPCGLTFIHLRLCDRKNKPPPG